ncbi:hypothetical protein C8J56DRAFT_214620 [Mycena floridula]|nr:hypothetical protein C8J56DRAFT_214620 [Mycena floridula]
MLLIALGWLLLAVVVAVQSAQEPLLSFDWDLTLPPHENSTSHLVFASASSFLQHWSNTRYRNGHSIVIGTIPAHTLLYHGRYDNLLPSRPEWTSIGPEHSYVFCNGPFGKECWHLILTTTRPLKVLYFDGSSAAKMLHGSMDSQDIVAYSKVLPDQFFAERERIVKLCDWGKKFGLDGFFRMEMDFELMLCDFTQGVEVVSFEHLVPVSPPKDAPQSSCNQATSGEPLRQGPEVIFAGSLHSHYPGERRLRLDYSKFLSFYDTSLAPSLVETRYGKHRLQHRIQGISDEDTAAIMTRLDSILMLDTEASSGIDWETLLRVISDRYAERLELLAHVLNSTSSDSVADLQLRAKKAQTLLHVVLQPYMLHSLTPRSRHEDPTNSWANPMFRMCSTIHTKSIDPALLTLSERLLLDAVSQTTREICRVLVNIWVDGVRAGLDSVVKLASDSCNSEEFVSKWYEEVTTLMQWLDWSVWLKCKPACDAESICHLPTWPYFRNGIPNLPRPSDAPAEEKPLVPQDWEDPQPYCIRRVEPYDMVT